MTGTSDVKIESPILERLVTVLNSERLFGHYDAYADIMNENSSLHGENKSLRERVRDMKSKVNAELPAAPSSRRSSSGEQPTAAATKTWKIDQSVQVAAKLVDSGCDPHAQEEEKVVPPPKLNRAVHHHEQQTESQCELTGQVERYQEKLCDLESQLDKVKRELHNLSEKHEAANFDWQRRETNWINEIAQKV